MFHAMPDKWHLYQFQFQYTKLNLRNRTFSIRSLTMNRSIGKSHSQNICLTHWGRVTHICVGNLTIIGSDNGLSPGRCQAISWTNIGILLIGPLGTNFSEMLIEIHTFSFKKIYFYMSSGKWRPFCLASFLQRHCATGSSTCFFSNQLHDWFIW